MTISSPAQRVFLGRYQVLRRLGEGGMAKVFLAMDRTSGREVVVKVMHDHLAKNPSVRQHFRRELELMKQFRHPGAVAWLDGCIEGAEPCLVMEYVRGVNLDEYVQQRGRIAPHRVGLWMGQLCPVLYAAHSMGILHRDLSLANLMLIDADTPNETIKVLDFGLARLSGSLYVPLEKLTGAVATLGGGTPDYVCPEQVRGDAVDARGDLYSVGVILFRLLTGKFPFQQFDQAADLLLAQIQVTPPTFAKVGIRDVPAVVETVVQHCLAKFPAERPASAKELAESFGRALGLPIAPPEAFPEPTAAPAEEAAPAFNPRFQVDRFEAFMPEQIAVVKLRGFIGEMGGEALDSEPGHIRMRFRDPREKTPEQAGFAWFGMSRKTKNVPEPKHLLLDLYMSKKQSGTRSLVEISVVMPPSGHGSRADGELRQGFADRICRELRPYLMIGR